MRTFEEIIQDMDEAYRKQGEENLERSGFSSPLLSPLALLNLIGATDEEFITYYEGKQREWFDDPEGIRFNKDIICSSCREKIETPQENLHWAGHDYHGECFIAEVDAGKRPSITGDGNISSNDYLIRESREYFNMIRRLVFKS